MKRAIQFLTVVLLTTTASFAATYDLRDYCFYSGALDTGKSCNPSAFASPFDGSLFDTSFTPNTLGSVKTQSLSAGVYTILAYLDYDISAATNGSFNEFATVTGAPGAQQGYFLGDPNLGLFSNEFTNATLTNTNNVGTATGLPDVCCDVAVVMGFKAFQIPVGFTGQFMFSVTDALPNAPWYITQTDPDTGDKIYFAQTVALRQLPPTGGIPEPSTFLTLGGGFAALVAFRRRRGPVNSTLASFWRW
ncbi:MAG: PEP-CTERM sorting domain-containing protein [Bryobacteraceae bacterium]|nr:PEP-CTERM sorting domain-containing protein [Bryobacteraceae bacterium]